MDRSYIRAPTVGTRGLRPGLSGRRYNAPVPSHGEILMQDELVALFAYDQWANCRVLDACRKLTAERYGAEPAPGVKTSGLQTLKWSLRGAKVQKTSGRNVSGSGNQRGS